MSMRGKHMSTIRARLVTRIRRRGEAARRSPGPIELARVPAPPGYDTLTVSRPTHLGPVFDRLVERVRLNRRPRGTDPDYDLVADNFDLTHFMLQARRLHDHPDVDPVAFFLNEGPKAALSPDVNFSMQAYLRRCPQRAGAERSPYLGWLKSGRARGEIADPADVEAAAPVLGRQPAELVSELASMRTDLQERFRSGVLGEMFARAAEVEPLIGQAWPETARPKIPPFTISAQLAAMHRLQLEAGFKRARLILVINRPRWGGGLRDEGMIARAMTRRIGPDEIVVIYTESSGKAPPNRYPAGVREINLADACATLRRPAAMRVLVELIRSLNADAVVNINSGLFYDALTPYGRALAATERIFSMMFCNEQTTRGNWVGYPLSQFYRHMDYVEGVITDSEHLAEWLRQRHQLPDASRIHVFPAPAPTELSLVDPPAVDPERRPQVFWAGRYDRQKRVDLVMEIARRMPDVDFRLWGESVLQQRRHLPDPPDNVVLEGLYAHICEIDLGAADAWLYTSAWDGVPHQLLEVAMTGIPLVGSLVGGTGEVLHDEDSWPVRDLEAPEAYEKALRDVLADPAGSRQRAAALRDRMLRDRTEEAFAGRALEVLLVDPEVDR